ncbi:PLP-dependent transferase [Phlegmacium glaucopus]|nr:PLP-dependent transferase [Phlegmacium glaucopus]
MATTYGNNHDAVAAWFLGPHAENFDVLENIFRNVLYEQEKARTSYFPDDDNYITPSIKATNLFQKNISKLKYVINQLAPRLAQHSIPFWNPRYNGHMNMDTTMPGMAGYLMGMMYNPNNVATEASPLTTVLELHVGVQLCEMVGLNTNVTKKPVGWGHITCGGTVANLESMWAARNLKYYPLSLRLAMKTGGPLEFIADRFSLPTFQESSNSVVTKLLKDFSSWELLNIAPDVVLDIPDRLRQQFFITPAFLQTALYEYLIQTIGKDSNMFREFEIDPDLGPIQLNKMVYFASAAKHYSWPKAAAVTGIGSDNFIDIQVDNDARLDISDLRARLDECLRLHRPVYTVVAIIGSTEQGACDPLDKIVELRDEFRTKGLSFVLHADAAWGAYFCSTLRSKGPSVPMRFVPSITLKPSTVKALEHLPDCDSITIDPHKSGYIQYPAGGLLYRDQRMRYLITWTSPIVYRGELENIGVYGIEGSKPGAAAVAAWVSHEVIGLHQDGYGALLGEAVFSCVKMYAHLATMSTDQTEFIVVPLNALPTNVLPVGIDLKEFIRTRILPVSNKELIKDNEAMKLIQAMGSDLAINAFAVNFRLNNGKVNEDVVEANNLGERIFEKLSVSSVSDRIQDRPLILTSTRFSKKGYGKCLESLKERLGLNLKDERDLYVLVNVVMSPFPTDFNFTQTIATSLESVIKQEVDISKFRNTLTPDFHGFVMQGTDKLYLVHLPMFNMENHRFQLIITGDIPQDKMDQYKKARAASPEKFFTLGTANRTTLESILRRKKFSAVIDKGLPPSDGTHLITDFELSNIEVIVKRPLDSINLQTKYPQYSMPFYLYGTSDQLHIDHILFTSPNTQLNSDQVKLEIVGQLPAYPVCCRLQLPEQAMQPLPSNNGMASDNNFFFRPRVTYDVAIFKNMELNEDGETPLAKGKLTLGDSVFTDTDMLNENPLPSAHAHGDVTFF